VEDPPVDLALCRRRAALNLVLALLALVGCGLMLYLTFWAGVAVIDDPASSSASASPFVLGEFTFWIAVLFGALAFGGFANAAWYLFGRGWGKRQRVIR
jgi:hypothetical protein